MDDDEILKMKHHKLLFELKFLYADLEYHQRIMNDATRTFQEEFLNTSKELKLYEILFPEDNVPEPTQQDSGEVENEKIYELDKKNISKEVKFLHKKIVSMTHPDKLVKLSEQERSHRENIFLKATEAAEKDNLFALQQIAMDLGIELPPPTEEQLEIFEKEANGVRRQTGDMEKTFAWNWHNSKSEEERQAIMAQYINIMAVIMFGSI